MQAETRKSSPFCLADLTDAEAGAGSQELIRSRILFGHAALAIAFELLLGEADEKVVVIAFYSRLLRHFRAFLEQHLDSILTEVSMLIGRAPQPLMTFETLVEHPGRLQFLTAHKAGGISEAVTVSAGGATAGHRSLLVRHCHAAFGLPCRWPYTGDD